MQTIPDISSKKATQPNILQKLREHGYSMAGWARVNGYNVTSVWLSLTGRMNGPLAREIRAKVLSLKG